MADDAALDRAGSLLRGADRVVALTGAGVSTESGIPDFRSPGGVWDRLDPSEFHIERFREDPARFWELRGRLMDELDLDAVEPNAAHRALARLAEAGKLRALVTQNIDGLHQEAGTPPSKVLEIHGSARRVRCLDCGERRPYEAARADLEARRLPPRCPDCGGVLKPDTVLFGERLPPDVQRAAFEAAGEADLMLVVGSSLQVTPAADLPRVAARSGAVLVIVNRDATPLDSLADVVLNGEAGTVVPALLHASGTAGDPEP